MANLVCDSPTLLSLKGRVKVSPTPLVTSGVKPNIFVTNYYFVYSYVPLLFNTDGTTAAFCEETKISI